MNHSEEVKKLLTSGNEESVKFAKKLILSRMKINNFLAFMAIMLRYNTDMLSDKEIKDKITEVSGDSKVLDASSFSALYLHCSANFTYKDNVEVCYEYYLQALADLQHRLLNDLLKADPA